VSLTDSSLAVYPDAEETIQAKAKTYARRAWLLTLCERRARRRSCGLVDVPTLTASGIRVIGDEAGSSSSATLSLKIRPF
jgi:hypothetical protein